MLSASNRLRHDKDIKTLFATGKSVFDPVCGVKFRKNTLPDNRFAIVVGTKVSKSAVERNKVRRRLREILRRLLPTLETGYDVMLMVRSAALRKTSAELEVSLTGALKKTPLWPRKPSSSSSEPTSAPSPSTTAR